ncbi:MAG: flagellar filament capping protein FliD [Lachnospiraceae bacterium]|nr:flagellar filament capping protein FliD [Lachnospiraceae bacterium]
MSDIFRLTGLNSGMDTESIITAMVSRHKTKVEDAVKEKTKLGWTQDAWKGLNTKIYGLYTNKLSNMRLSSYYDKLKTTTSNSALTVTAGTTANEGVQTAKIKSVAKAGYLTGAEISTKDGGKVTNATKLTDLGITAGSSVGLKVDGLNHTIEVTEDMTMGDFVKKLQNAGVNASFDEGNQRLFVSAKATGADKDFLFTDTGNNTNAALAKLGLTASAGAKRIKGEDAVLELNGAEFKSSTNTFNINGSTYTVNGLTDEEITVSTAKDTSGIYDMIKNFFKDYNDVMESMATAYNAESAKGYEPLTDEQKEAMTESQVEDWEKKIKDSLLRKDSTLNTLMSSMREIMGSGIEIDGKKYYLSDFGIETQSYLDAEKNQRYNYHINGDKDDTISSAKTDVLSAKIAEDPELVEKFFKELSAKMYDNLTEKMSSTESRSIYKVYNDKQMATEYSEYTKKIAELEKKLTEAEDRYYKKFSNMEVALSKMTSNQNAISSLFQM